MKATATKRKLREITESVRSAPGKVNFEKGIIPRVKILGTESKNGYGYSEESRSKAVAEKIYEGRPVNFDHLSREDEKSPVDRPGTDEVGFIQDVFQSKADGCIYGDLHVYESHPYGPYLLEKASKSPLNFGLSHVASAEFDDTGDAVKDIAEVLSVDVVRNPATNDSLYESEAPKMKTDTPPSEEQKEKSGCTNRKAGEMLSEMEGSISDTVAAVLQKASAKLPNLQEMEVPDADNPKDAMINVLAESLNSALDMIPGDEPTEESDEEGDEEGDETEYSDDEVNESLQGLEAGFEILRILVSEGISPTDSVMQRFQDCETREDAVKVIKKIKESSKMKKPTLKFFSEGGDHENDCEYSELTTLIESAKRS